MIAWRIERLQSHHEREGFDCGNVELNAFLLRFSGQNERKGLGRTYVAVADPDGKRVVGYYTISTGHVVIEHLAAEQRRGLPRYPLPVVRLGRLAVDVRYQRQGLGALLLRHGLGRALAVSATVGVYAVDVTAKDERARDFYVKFGFIPLVDSPMHLFLPLETIRRAAASGGGVVE